MIPKTVSCPMCGYEVEVATYRKFVKCPVCGEKYPFEGFEYEIIHPNSSMYASVEYWMDCPACRSRNMYFDRSRKLWECPDCRYTVKSKENSAQYYSSVMNPLYAFTNITCIGDSLTHGVVTTDSQGGYRIAKYPYPAVLGRITGATIEEIAHGGYGATDWWTAYADSIVSKTNQLALVFLGTNDGLTDTVATDCAGDDYTTFANTNTGSYGKIVGKLKSVGAKIILLQCFTGEGNLSNTNKAIKDIADKFGCGLITTKRLLNTAYYYYPDLSGTDSLHFNDLGYSAFADFIVQQISFMSSDYLKYIIPD